MGGETVSVGIVGAGRFGTTVAAQLGQMRDVRLVAVGDIRPDNARAALRAAGYGDEQIGEAATPGQVADARAAGRAVLTTDPLAIAHSDVDVVVEVTGVPAVAALVVSEALGHGRHVVNVTVEADVLLGAYFARRAAANGAIYSVADGDQPGVTRRLIGWATALGYRIVAAGRGTRFYPFDAEGQPEDAFARYGFSDDLVTRRRYNAQMYNSFRDGSKAQIEMTSLANMTGLVPDVRGMHQPSAGVGDLARCFCPQEYGGLLAREGVVELANAVAPDGESLLPDELTNGVFVVLGTDNPLLAEDATLWGLPGHAGRYAALYRPYHLSGLEVGISVASAALRNEPTGSPTSFLADVAAIAKRGLAAGETLDGEGGYCVYGKLLPAQDSLAVHALPIGLAKGVRLERPVAAGATLTWADIEPMEGRDAVRVRREMEALFRPFA